MNGTFLNFFECKLNNDVIEAYSIDYIDKNHFDELRQKYPDIFFYRFEGNKIYYWKRRKNANIPVELKGTCIHLKLNDYPNIFKVIVTNSVAELFENNGAVVHKNKHSSTFEIESNNNVTKAIVGLEAGDSKTIEIDSENAFGPRNKQLIQLIPMKEFKRQGMTPVPGMKITSEGSTGKILTVNGGRVKVDFNHELAGKDLIFDVDVTEIIDNDEDKIKSMIELHYAAPNMDINKTVIDIDGDVVNITLDDVAKFDQKSYMDVTFARFRIAKDIWENMDFEKVNFVDSFEKKQEEDEEEAEE